LKLILSSILRAPDGTPHDHFEVERDGNGTPLQYAEAHPMAGRPKQKYVGPLTLRQVLYMAANSQYEGEKLGTLDLLKRGKLARKVGDKSQDEKNFTAAEITDLVTCCTKRLAESPEIFLSVMEHLEPEHEELKRPDPSTPTQRIAPVAGTP
jgi:hypothetical protein